MQAKHLSETDTGDRGCGRVAVIHRYGDPNLFQIEDIDLPHIKPDQRVFSPLYYSVNGIKLF